MRTILVILCLLVALSTFSQEFTGRIIYKTKIIAKHDGTNTDSILDASSGDSAVYYVSGSQYACTFFRHGKERYQYIYHHSKFQFYFLHPGIEYITWSDSRKAHNIVKDFKIFRDSTSTILGYPCYKAEKIYDNYISIAYYSDSIKVNPETFKDHNGADWYNELKRTDGSFNINTISDYKDYLEITEAIQISPMVVSDDIFKLPENRPIVASAYALDKKVSMLKNKRTSHCYTSKASQLQKTNNGTETLRCLIAIVVSADGSIKHVRPQKEDEHGAFRVAIDIIENCGITFIPGEIKGKPVDSECYVPVDFQL